MKTLMPSVLAVILVLATNACQRDSTADPSAYLAQVRSQTRADLDQGTGYGSFADAQANAEAGYEVALAQAEADLKLTKARCEAGPPGERASCIVDAESEFASARAAARAERDAAVTVARREFGNRDSGP